MSLRNGAPLAVSAVAVAVKVREKTLPVESATVTVIVDVPVFASAVNRIRPFSVSLKISADLIDISVSGRSLVTLVREIPSRLESPSIS